VNVETSAYILLSAHYLFRTTTTFLSQIESTNISVTILYIYKLLTGPKTGAVRSCSRHQQT